MNKFGGRVGWGGAPTSVESLLWSEIFPQAGLRFFPTFQPRYWEAFQLVDEALQNSFFIDLFQGTTAEVPMRVITRLQVKKGVWQSPIQLCLPGRNAQPPVFSQDNWTQLSGEGLSSRQMIPPSSCGRDRRISGVAICTTYKQCWRRPWKLPSLWKSFDQEGEQRCGCGSLFCHQQ